MIPELGQFALILALALALLQVVFPLWGSFTQRQSWMRMARSTALGQFCFVAFAFACLTYAFIVNDFSVAYVAQNSNTHLPLFYRIGAVWGAHEGSLLLWVFILSVWTALVSIFSRSLPLPFAARVLAVMGMISVGFYLFLLTTSNPFVRLLPNFPVNGRDLNPILQDPGLMIHPPMLYMGYVGFSVAFAFAIAALIGGRMDAVWARWARPWTLAAWCFLTFGIVLGSWWAYRELGWGGWWFWDPVENASFLPWLVGTALLHSLVVTGRRNVFKAWTVLLAVCAFSLSLLGTFLVRSGVLISVHAFAVDPQRGLFMLRFLALVVGSSLALYAWRAKTIVNTGHFGLLSRESLLLMNNTLLFIAMVTVLLGTLYPLIISALGLGKISVGAPYFNWMMVPILFPLLFVMGVGPLFQWRMTSLKDLTKPLLVVLLLSVAVTGLVAWWLVPQRNATVILGLFLAAWIAMNLTYNQIRQRAAKRQWAMLCAHLGVVITLIGVLFASSFSLSKNISMQPGDHIQIGGYDFQLMSVMQVPGPNYTAAVAKFFIFKHNALISKLYPQIRMYPVEQTSVSKIAIDVSMTRDLYVALGAPLSDGAWSVRIYYKPYIRWIWFGGLLMIVGGIIAIVDRKRAYSRRK